jgi:NCS2 family nucleobase:cation symporter-2
MSRTGRDIVNAEPRPRKDLSVTQSGRVKPANLIYSVAEVPPLPLTIVLGIQHVFVMSVGWIFVVVVATSIGCSALETQNMIRMSMIASGLATILQAQTKGPIGSGYLCPFSCGPAYVSASILAGQVGGLPLLWGMTTFSGIFEGLLSRVMKRLQRVFPPEVTGLVVALVGIELIGIGAPRFLGYDATVGRLDMKAGTVALITLAAMLAPTLWGKSKLRLYPVLIGLFVGYIASIVMRTLTPSHVRQILEVPLVGFPGLPSALRFQFGMVFPFVIASVCSILKTVGDLTLCEKINDSEWKRTDLKEVSGGILAGGICSALSGLLGGVGQSTFSSNVGLSMATGATSRVIAWPAGLICIALAFFPRLAAIFSIMPAPVMGAVVVYVACFMILGGLQVMLSRMLDARRIFVIGIALVFGLSVETVPGMYATVPGWIRPLFSSSLALGTVLVVVLNLLFQLGTSKRRTFEVNPAAALGGDNDVRRIMEALGATWGMRPEVATRAANCLHELMIYFNHIGVRAPVHIDARFDEFDLNFDIDYAGPAIQFPDQPPKPETIASEADAMPLLCAYVIRGYADGVSTSSQEGKSRIHLHFEH